MQKREGNMKNLFALVLALIAIISPVSDGRAGKNITATPTLNNSEIKNAMAEAAASKRTIFINGSSLEVWGSSYEPQLDAADPTLLLSYPHCSISMTTILTNANASEPQCKGTLSIPVSASKITSITVLYNINHFDIATNGEGNVSFNVNRNMHNFSTLTSSYSILDKYSESSDGTQAVSTIFKSHTFSLNTSLSDGDSVTIDVALEQNARFLGAYVEYVTQ